MRHIVLGGGAAGYFSAITFAQNHPHKCVLLLEKHLQVLSKVRISGGGRCNVTHCCFDPKILVQNYPRGSKELIGPFHRFQPKDTMTWFETRRVPLKVEADGRIFPISDKSESIIQCLLDEARLQGVQTRLNTSVQAIEKTSQGFVLHLVSGEILQGDTLLLATGSSSNGHAFAAALGHTIIPCVPSLFTFNIPSSSLSNLAGISLAKVRLTLGDFHQEGPLLITHWGFSGPAVLKLSAWAARYLHSLCYQTDLSIHWLPDLTVEQIREKIQQFRISCANKHVSGESPFDLPKNLWKAFLETLHFTPTILWSSISKKDIERLVHKLTCDIYRIQGKTTYKNEFVTCGGVSLSEVNFKTMESKICKGLYFAGEILDIDGVTGGFNFQAAWTTGWIAGQPKF